MTTPSTGKNQTTTPIKLPYFVADQRGKYRARAALTEDQIIKAAKTLLNKRIQKGDAMTSPALVRAWLQASYRDLEHEVFICMFLDNQGQMIKAEELFRGTINGASVYPREIVKRALQLNAATVMLAHNHPSGILKPSTADIHITKKLKEALSLVDIETLDHFIIGNGPAYSFAEHGLI